MQDVNELLLKPATGTLTETDSYIRVTLNSSVGCAQIVTVSAKLRLGHRIVVYSDDIQRLSPSHVAGTPSARYPSNCHYKPTTQATPMFRMNPNKGNSPNQSAAPPKPRREKNAL